MIEIRDLSKRFTVGGRDVHALKHVDIRIEDGEIFGIIGMSGAGKSTLVRCINMLERPTSGTVLVDGHDMVLLNAEELRLARRKITMIFQGFNLLMQRTCLANICFPLELAGISRATAARRANELLELVGLPDKAAAYPAQLSGGQQQRIAIARALATEPRVLLCDEATSALDPKTTHDILALLRDINHRLGITMVVITHQMSVVEEICARVAILDQGQVVEQGTVATVFARPKSAAAKRLVFPDGVEEMTPAPSERIVRVVFNGSLTADKPLITQMAIDEHIAANIRYASTRCLDGKVYGTMLLGLPDSDDVFQRAKNYLAEEQVVSVEEV